jgi:hypothetical protein
MKDHRGVYKHSNTLDFQMQEVVPVTALFCGDWLLVFCRNIFTLAITAMPILGISGNVDTGFSQIRASPVSL